ncbi:MAG: hypothetical protein ACR2GK_03020 [Gemmatimonadaceae bacterium]
MPRPPPKRHLGEMLDIEEFRAAVMDHAELPRVPTPMILRRDEVAHLRIQRAVWRELRTTPGAMSVTGSFAVIEMGQLYITNQRNPSRWRWH